MRTHVLMAALVLAIAGCGAEKQTAEPVSDATHVSGTLTAIDDDRPVDGGVTLTVRTADGKDEPVYVASIFTGQPPTSVVLALQQQVNELKIGDKITATGTRDGEGRFNADVIRVLE